MFYIKFQLACLVVMIYIIGIYVHDSRQYRVPFNRLFVAYIVACPLAVFFDGATSWTVNHMGTVPPALNLGLHGAFFISMVVVLIIAFLYMVELTNGIPSSRAKRVLLLVPGVLSIAVIIAFLPQLYYIEGRITWYSMGVSVIAAYASVIVHFGLILGLLVFKRRSIEARKFTSFAACLILSFLFLFIQVVWPETLISALPPTFMLVCFYINFEDPSIKQLNRFNATMVMGFATLVENRDNSTGGHIQRTKGYVEMLLRAMRRHPRYARVLTRDYMNNIANAAPMHDIGKIATPDRILQKPGKLTDEEFAVMKLHAADGGEIIRETFADIDDPEYSEVAYEMARHHHEKWNGRGYPDGLRGEQIPLHARIMAIADVFDAVSAKRCYRDALPLDTCFKIIEEGAGSDFDPELAALFLQQRSEVTALWEALR
ncbi:MAG: HD-GYP domain-containing protein [Coriobacteriales bacterium]